LIGRDEDEQRGFQDLRRRRGFELPDYGPALRIMLAYEHVDLGKHNISDVGQIAAQAIFF